MHPLEALKLYEKTAYKKDPRDWMSDVPGERNITQLTIPGTHNSHANRDNIQVDPSLLMLPVIGPIAATISGNLQKNYGTCQTHQMWEQLQFGVRYFDLRVRSWSNIDGVEDYGLCHGSVILKESLGAVLNGMADFLNNHPGETLLISIKWDEERIDGFEKNGVAEPDYLLERVSQIWAEHNWYTGASWPKLNDVRGKAILLRRFRSPNRSFGIDLHEPSFYNNERSSNPEGKWKQMRDPGADKCQIDEVWDKTHGILEEAKSANFDDNVMYFSSTCNVWFDAVDGWTPQYYAERLNPKLEEYMLRSNIKPSNSRFGVVVTDFCNLSIARSILSLNFHDN